MEINQGVFELDPSEYVSSLNSLTGDVILAAGTNISLVPVGNTITINATDTDTGITQLTGDVTAGPGSGSQIATLAIVNSNVGSFGTASSVGTFTVNAKGLVTAASNTSIQIAESQVTNLVSDLASKVMSVSGTADRITSTGGTTPVIDISASYVGQASITTLGTITAGVWNGTAIANANLANSSITIGSTAISLGATSTTLAGLTSVTSTGFTGALTGNASTATALETGRTISITGDLAYTSGSFDGTGNVTGTGTLATVNANVGTFGSATQTGVVTVNAKGLITAASNTTITPAVGSITGLGTGVATALAVNVGSAGAFVTFNGALGTPSSGTLTNATGLPISTGVSGLGANVATFLATPSSANLISAVTDETGSGALVFGTSPTFTTNITSPLVIGGTGTTDDLILQSTSGVGTTGADIIFKAGNNGATEVGRMTNDADWWINGASLGFSFASGSAIAGPNSASFYGNSGDFHMISNGYTTLTGTGWKYMTNGTAANLYMFAGDTVFRNAASGTAGNDITWTETMRITANAAGRNVKIAGTATRGTTEGTNHLDIFNGTAPVGTLTNGNSVYSTSGILQAMDAAGNNSFVADVRKYGRATAQTGAVATVATYTTIADNSFEISANVLVTTSTTHNFTVTCAYTDEGNTARTLTLMFSSLAGGVVTAIANAAGAVPYAGIPVHIRAKSGTAITIATTGTFTTVTYNVEGIIRQIQ